MFKAFGFRVENWCPVSLADFEFNIFSDKGISDTMFPEVPISDFPAVRFPDFPCEFPSGSGAMVDFAKFILQIF